VPFPEKLLDLKGPLFVGLTENPERLEQLRRTRLRADQMDPRHGDNEYLDLERIKTEIIEARRMFTKNGWPVIDVTRRSIEETAAEIQMLLNRRADGQKQTDISS
jgi:regulator of PEP synthase PpsR (kinase-PPPase family)